MNSTKQDWLRFVDTVRKYYLSPTDGKPNEQPQPPSSRYGLGQRLGKY